MLFSYLYINPHKIAWIGDYSYDTYPNTEAYTRILPYEQFIKYYDAVWNDDEYGHAIITMSKNSFSPDDLNIINNKLSSYYLVKHNKKCYLYLDTYDQKNTTKDGWYINPLPLLTACGYGRGGGDYHGYGDGHVGVENVSI